MSGATTKRMTPSTSVMTKKIDVPRCTTIATLVTMPTLSASTALIHRLALEKAKNPTLRYTIVGNGLGVMCTLIALFLAPEEGVAFADHFCTQLYQLHSKATKRWDVTNGLRILFGMGLVPITPIYRLFEQTLEELAKRAGRTCFSHILDDDRYSFSVFVGSSTATIETRRLTSPTFVSNLLSASSIPLVHPITDGVDPRISLPLALNTHLDTLSLDICVDCACQGGILTNGGGLIRSALDYLTLPLKDSMSRFLSVDADVLIQYHIPMPTRSVVSWLSHIGPSASVEITKDQPTLESKV